MARVNKTFLLGNLVADPNVRYSAKGVAIAEITIAVNRLWTDEGGRKEQTDFIDVTLYGRLAEVAQQYLKKGPPAHVEGRLQLDTWEGKQTG